MPPAIAALTTFLAPVFGAWAGFVANAIVFVAQSVALNALSKKPKLPGYLTEAQDRHHIIRSAVAPRRVVVGRSITSGPLIAAGAVDGPTGNAHEILYMAVALAGHQCEEIQTVLLNDEASDSLRFGSTQVDVILDNIYFADAVGGNLTITINGTPFTVAAVNDFGPWEDTAYNGVNVANRTNKANLIAAIQADPGYATAGYTVAAGSEEYCQIAGIATVLGRQRIEIRGTDGTPVTVGVSTTGDHLIEMSTDELQAADDWLTISKNLGAADQAADAMLLADLPGIVTADHRARYVCYVALKLVWNADVWYSGIPQVSAVVKGTNQVYDPRDLSTGWSDNPALLVRSYLTSVFGMNVPTSRIDDDSVIAAANICDEIVDNGPYTTGKRFTCNGSFTLDEKPRDILSALLSSMGGRLTYWGGKYRVHAAAYDAPTITITDDDLRGPIKVRVRRPRNELFNGVRGTFVSPDKSWQATDYPPITNATYKTQDNNEEIWGDLNLPMTTSHWEAQRLAKIELERNRRGGILELPLKWTALNLRIWDTVTVSSDSYQASGIVRVISFRLDPANGITVVCQEEDPSIYDWASTDGTEIDDLSPWPDPEIVPEPPSGLSYEIVSFDVAACVRIYATPSTSAFVTGYDVQYRTVNGGDGEWYDAPANVWQNVYSSPTEWHGDICGVPVGQYEIRVRAVNGAAGTHSKWVSLSILVAAPKLSFSPNVSGLELVNGANSTQFTVKDPKFVWRKASGFNSDGTDFYLKDYEVKAIDSNGNVIATGYTMSEELVIYHQQNAAAYEAINGTPGSYRTFTIEVRARGQQGQISALPAKLTVSNPSPALPTNFSVEAHAGGAGEASFTPPSDLDWAGTLIWLSTSGGFTPSGTEIGEGNVAYAGPDHVIRFTGAVAGQTYYLRYASYDIFDRTGLTISDEYSITIPIFDPNDTTAPATPTGMGSTTGMVNTSQSSLAYIEMYWSANAEADLAGYIVQGGRTSEVNWTTLAGVVEARVNADTEKLRAEYCIPGVGYSWRVAAFDLTGNVGSFCAVQTKTAQTDTSAPSTPTGVSLTAVVRSLKLTFTGVSDADLAYYEIYASTSSGFTPDTSTFTNLAYRGLMTAHTYENASDATYYVKICAVDWSGNRSSFTSQVSATIAKVTGGQIGSSTISQTNMGGSSVGTSQLRNGETTHAKRQTLNTQSWGYSLSAATTTTHEFTSMGLDSIGSITVFSGDDQVWAVLTTYNNEDDVTVFLGNTNAIDSRSGTLSIAYW